MNAKRREGLARLHTWAGVLGAVLLLFIFWTGSLSVFDQELDRWMMPNTRVATVPSARLTIDDIRHATTAIVTGADQLWFKFPDTRNALWEFWFVADASGWQGPYWLHPVTGAVLDSHTSLGASGFFFPLHYQLTTGDSGLGLRVVALAGCAMLVLMISGVLIHSNLVRQFFVYRPRSTPRRRTLDLHNLLGVAFFPVHVLIIVSGLAVFFYLYFPQSAALTYQGHDEPGTAFVNDAFGHYSRPAAGERVPLSDLGRLVAKAESVWGEGEVGVVHLWYPGDANSYADIRRTAKNHVRMNLDQLYLDTRSAELLHRFEARPVMQIQRFLAGFHFMYFEHWGLRWLYFISGLAGFALIATGLLFWVKSRERRHAQRGMAGAVLMRGVLVGSTCGLINATLAYLVANLLVACAGGTGPFLESNWEVAVFFGVWIGCLTHAVVRPATAWRPQTLAIALLAFSAVVFNAVTTGDHLLQAISRGLSAVAGVDIVLLITAAAALFAYRRRGHV